MNVDDAAFATVAEHPGGAEALAPRLGMSAGILRGKVNPNDKLHKLSVAEAVQLQVMTSDHRILHSMAAALNEVCLPVATFDGVADIELLEAYAQTIADEGRFADDFRKALADGAISSVEFGRLRDDMQMLHQHEAALMARIESLVDSSIKDEARLTVLRSRRPRNSGGGDK